MPKNPILTNKPNGAMRASPPTTNIYIKIVGDDAHIVPIFPVSFSAVKYFVGDDAYKSPAPTNATPPNL